MLPVLSDTLPAGQRSQVSCASLSLNKPTLQSSHVPPVLDLRPFAHSGQNADPLSTVPRPGLHSEHAVFSVASVNQPAGHSEHSGWPSRPLDLPGIHGRHAAEALAG